VDSYLRIPTLLLPRPQNDIMELWSLCNFVMPAVFKAKEQFAQIYK
jgi:SNF2 family DNA or RNA helicase